MNAIILFLLIFVIIFIFLFMETQYMIDLRYEIRKRFRVPKKEKPIPKKSLSTASIEQANPYSFDEKIFASKPEDPEPSDFNYRLSTIPPFSYSQIYRDGSVKSNSQTYETVDRYYDKDPQFVRNQRIKVQKLQQNENSEIRQMSPSIVTKADSSFWKDRSISSSNHQNPTVLPATVTKVPKKKVTGLKVAENEPAPGTSTGKTTLNLPKKPGGGGMLKLPSAGTAKTEGGLKSGTIGGGKLGGGTAKPLPKLSLSLKK